MKFAECGHPFVIFIVTFTIKSGSCTVTMTFLVAASSTARPGTLEFTRQQSL